MEEWQEWLAGKQAFVKEQEAAKRELLGSRFHDDDYRVEPADVTVVLDTKEETVKL